MVEAELCQPPKVRDAAAVYLESFFFFFCVCVCVFFPFFWLGVCSSRDKSARKVPRVGGPLVGGLRIPPLGTRPRQAARTPASGATDAVADHHPGHRKHRGAAQTPSLRSAGPGSAHEGGPTKRRACPAAGPGGALDPARAAAGS